jgi:hypothetical protein
VRKRLLFIPLVLVLVAAGVVAYVAWPRGATPVTEDEALHDFRARDTSMSDQATGVPPPGVYTFAATGQEEVKLGVLPSQTRPYPGTVNVVIVDTGPRCFTTTVNLLDQHREDTTYCVTDDGSLRIEHHEKRQEVGALRPQATMTCDPDALVVPDVDSTALDCRLSLSGGPAAVNATLHGTSTSERTTVEVGGQPVDAVAVDVRYQISGDLSGSWDERVWFAVDDWLPLRIERELDLRGPASFTERSELTLRSLEPAT